MSLDLKAKGGKGEKEKEKEKEILSSIIVCGNSKVAENKGKG